MLENRSNIQRLCKKLQVRFGANDALVLQLKRELDSIEACECNHGKWSVPYYVFIKAQATEPC